MKDAIVENTGGAFDIFLSSDGQSIPLGKNWVYEIQDALEKTTVLFVFVSPNSLGSSWVYFEAGYTYSKRIKVVPVGIRGIVIDAISPPLGLLNGFHIEGYDDLNKIIVTINEALKQQHKFRFTQKEYLSIFQDGAAKLEHELRSLISEVTCSWSIKAEIPGGYKPKKTDVSWYFEPEQRYILDKFEEFAVEEGWQYSRTGAYIQFGGISVFVDDRRPETAVYVSAIGDAIIQHPDKWKRINCSVFNGTFKGQEIKILLKPYLDFEKNENKLAFSLTDSPIALEPNGGYRYGDYCFRISGRKPIGGRYGGSFGFKPSDESAASIRIYPQTDVLDFDDVNEILDILIERSVLVSD